MQNSSFAPVKINGTFALVGILSKYLLRKDICSFWRLKL